MTDMAVSAQTAGRQGSDAWNPGLVSGLPRAVRPLATVFRPENVEASFTAIEELSDVSGLPAVQLAPFRAERLAVHEVLARVTADLSVPIGAVYADLGVNFRRIAETLLRDGVAPRMAEVAGLLDGLRAQAEALLDREIAGLFAEPAGPERTARARGWRIPLPFSRRPETPAPKPEPLESRALRRLDARCAEASERSPDGLEAAACEALRTVAASLIGRQGFLVRDPVLLRRLALVLVSNGYGSRRIGETIEPWIEGVIDRERYTRVGPQARPVVLNVKGASASGKSTIRPYQRELAARIGAPWPDFAVITPDVWRKYLLDYDGLGEAGIYAGPLTGHEVEIVDAKLDRIMARKAAEGRISHLLIDRFRFDSFSTDARGDRSADGGGQLLTRFGHSIYLQFMVTAPEATVERAWKRGRQFGRYKAVEDLLAHNVEAYSGMPRLFFLWALRRDRAVFFEFLDNGVPEGCRPRTIAFGARGAMTVLDPAALLDIDRFRKVNIHARCPEEVYAGVDLDPARNAGFLRDCLARMPSVRFAERTSGRVFALFESGRLAGLDGEVLARVAAEPTMRAALRAAGLTPGETEAPPIAERLDRAQTSTLGAWGSGTAAG